MTRYRCGCVIRLPWGQKWTLEQCEVMTNCPVTPVLALPPMVNPNPPLGLESPVVVMPREESKTPIADKMLSTYFPNVSFGEFERRKIEKILRDAGVHE